MNPSTQEINPMLDIAFKIIGAGAWVPALFLLYDRFFTKSKLVGKLVSLAQSDRVTFEYRDSEGNPQTIIGLGVFGKLHIQAKNKDFIINDVKAFVKKTGAKNELDAHLIWTTKTTLGIDGVKKRLTLPPDKYIKFISCIKAGASNHAYFNCVVPQSAGTNWEWIRFEFTDLSNNTQSVKIKISDIDSMCILFESELWTPDNKID